jgi:hypothetical protein
MSQGLPRKLRYAFILQVVLASLVVVVGAVVTGSIVKDALTDQQLRGEAQEFWNGRARDPAYPLPRSSTIQGYFVADAQLQDQVPAELRRYGIGVSDLPGGNRKLIVDERPQGRLYLVMSFDLLDAIIARGAGIDAAGAGGRLPDHMADIPRIEAARDPGELAGTTGGALGPGQTGHAFHRTRADTGRSRWRGRAADQRAAQPDPAHP